MKEKMGLIRKDNNQAVKNDLKNIPANFKRLLG